MKNRLVKTIAAVALALTLVVMCMPMAMAAQEVKGYALGPIVARYYDDGSLVFEGEGELSGYLSSDSDNYNGYAIPWEENSDKITSVVISEGITSCTPEMLGGLDNVKEITIPGKGFTVDENTFSECDSVEKFIISGDSDAYAVDASGDLYNKDMTKLIKSTDGKSATDSNANGNANTNTKTDSANSNSSVNNNNSADNEDSGNSSTIIIVAIAAAVIVLIIAIVAVVLVKKK